MPVTAVKGETMTAVCDVCGNYYEQAFEVKTASGEVHTFDSFECAIHRLAPHCERCGCKIIGHGSVVSDKYYCCAHCARNSEQPEGTSIKDAVGV